MLMLHSSIWMNLLEMEDCSTNLCTIILLSVVPSMWLIVRFLASNFDKYRTIVWHIPFLIIYISHVIDIFFIHNSNMCKTITEPTTDTVRSQ